MRLCPRQPADISLIRRRSRLPGGIGATPSGNSGKTYLASQYARIKGRRGHKKAIGAVAHSILTIAYHVLQRGRPYAELGPDYLLLRDNAEAYTKRLVRQLERLGHKVTLERLPLSA